MLEDQLTDQNDPFPQVTSPKFPKKVADILRQQGQNVSSMEKSFANALQAGGETKQQAVINAYNLFDEVQGTTQFRNTLQSYQRSNQNQSTSVINAPTQKPRNENTNTALAAPKSQEVVVAPTEATTAPSAPTQEGIQWPGLSTAQENDSEGVGKFFDIALKAGWNSIVDKAKGLSQAIVAGQFLSNDYDDAQTPEELRNALKSESASQSTLLSVGTSGENSLFNIFPTQPQTISETDSSSTKLKKKQANNALQAEKEFSAKSKAIGSWFDNNLKADIPQGAQQAPVYYDEEKGGVQFDRFSDVRSWANMIGGAIGGTAGDMAVAAGATRVARGKSAQTQAAIKNGVRTLTFISSTAQMFPGYLQEGLDNGLSYGDALKVAGPLAVVNGSIELVGMDYMMKGFGFGKPQAQQVVRDVLNTSAKSAIKQLAAKDITIDTFLDTIKKSAMDAFKDLGSKSTVGALKVAAKSVGARAGKVMSQGFVPEFGEELAQGSLEGAAQGLYNTFVASKGAKPGEGKYDTSVGEVATNTLLGAVVGGVVGGMAASTYNSAPKLYDQTMFSYANTDIRHQISEGAQSLNDIKSQGKIFKKIEEWRNNGEFDVVQNGQPVFNEQQYQQVVDNANMMYDTAWEFRNFKDFSDTDRFDMFSIAQTRSGLKSAGSAIEATKEQVAQIDEMLTNYDAVEPDEYGDKPSELMLMNQRSDIARQLGPVNPDTGLYQQEEIFQQRASRIDNIIMQAVPAINETSTRRAGRAFLKNGIDAVESLQNPDLDTFEMAQEVELPDGSIAVLSEESVDADAQVRQLVVTETPGSVLDQIESGKYKPVERYQFRTEPIDNYDSFVQAISSPSRKVARDTTRPYNVAADATEVIQTATQLAAQRILEPANQELYNQQIEKAFKLYEQIASHKDAQDDGVSPVTREQFNQTIGLQVDQQVENTDQNVESVDELEAQPVAETPSNVRSLLDQPILYNGQRANLTLDGQTIIASPIGTNQIFEVGNIDEIGDSSPEEFGISPEEITVQVNDNGMITVRDKVYRNGYSNPTSAINRNNKGEITSVTLDEGTTGTKRTFRGQTAQDIAYEIILSENAKDNATEQQFNEFAESNEFVQREIMDAESAVASEERTNEDTDGVSGSQESEVGTEPTGDTENTGIDETTERQGDQGNRQEAPSLESEYVGARQLNQVVSNITELQQGLQQSIGSANEIASSISEGEEITGSINGLIGAIESVNRNIEQLDGQISADIIEDGNETQPEPGNSSVSTEGTVQNEPTQVTSRPRRTTRNRNPNVLAALNKFPNNIQDEVDQYFIGGGKIKASAIQDLVSGNANQEIKNLIGIQNNTTGLTIDGLAQRLWEETSFPGLYETSEYRDAIESTIREFPGLTALTARVNNTPVENVDTSIDSEGVLEEVEPDAFLENIRRSQEDPGFVPFSFTTPDSRTAGTFSLNGQNTFYHASGRTRTGRLRENTAPQFGKGVYFSTNRDLVTGEFGDNVTEVGLDISNPVYTNTPQWNAVERQAIQDADTAYGQQRGLTLDQDQGFYRYDPDDLSEINEISPEFISLAAKKLGHDAIIDEGSSTYENEIIVLDESKIVYTEDSSREILPVINQIAKAFPNITLNIPVDQDAYLQGLNAIENARQIFNSESEVPYGYINPGDGSVTLDPSRLNANTPFHEYGHIWSIWAENNNPALYNRGIELIRNGTYIERVKRDPNYAGLTEKQQLDEALAMAIGDKGESFVLSSRKKSFKEWLNNLFNDVKKFFGLRNATPEQIADMNLETFTNSVIADLLSGESISEISSQDISDILSTAGLNQEVEPVDDLTPEQAQENMNRFGDILFSFRTPQPWGSRPGEQVGSAQSFKTEAETRLAAIVTSTQPTLFGTQVTNKLTDFTPAERAEIDKIQQDTGWKYLGNGEWNFDISTATNPELNVNEFYFTDDERINKIPVNSPQSSAKGTIAQTIQDGINLINESDKVGKKLMNTLLRSTRVLNIESVVSMIDNENGIITQLIKNVKRQGSQRKDLAQNILRDPFANYATAMAPFTTYNAGSTLSQVKKVEVSVIMDGGNGKVEQKKVWMPVSVAMNLARTEHTQLVMGDKYLTKPDIKGVSEKRSALVLDDRHFDANGNLLNPNDRSILYGKEGIQLGAHLRVSEIEEMNASGKLEPLNNATNNLGDKASPPVFLLSNKEIKRLMRRFESGVGAEPGEVEAYKLGTEFFNNKQIQDLLAIENDKFLNPAKPFGRVSFYAPLSTVKAGNADAIGTQFSPNLEDSKRLHEREGRPDALYIQDDLRAAKSYSDGITTVLGSGRLVHNIKNIRDAINKENANNPETKILVSYFDDYINAMQSYNSAQSALINKDFTTRFANTLLSKYTKYIFRSINPISGISLTQTSTYLSAFGQGFIKDKYLTQAFPSMVKYIGGSYWDSVTLAGSTINQTTGKGLTNALGRDTTERSAVEYMLGYGITDPAQRARHLKRNATLISRTLAGSNLFVAGIDFLQDPGKLASGGGVQQALNKIDQWMEENLMASIRRNDRGVIFTYMDAAKLEAADMGLTGEAFDTHVSEATINMVYATNQLGDLTETSELQRDPNPFVKFIISYTGQVQKLFNNLVQAFVEWKKYGVKSTTPAAVRDMMETRINGAMITNFMAVPATIASFGVLSSILKAAVNGEPLKEREEYAQALGFNLIRTMTGIFPSIVGQLGSFVVSSIDLEKWTDNIFEIPGEENFEKTAEEALKAMKNIATGEKIKDKELNTLVADATRLIAIWKGVPKSAVDLLQKRVFATEKPKRKRAVVKEPGETSDEDLFVEELF